MAISDEITRLQQAKAALKTSIEGKGVTVSSSATLDDYADLVDSIEAGGGGDPDVEGIDLDLTGMGTSYDNPYIIHITKPLTLLRIIEYDEVTEYYQFENRGRYTKVMDINDETIPFVVKCSGASFDNAVGYRTIYKSDQFH